MYLSNHEINTSKIHIQNTMVKSSFLFALLVVETLLLSCNASTKTIPEATKHELIQSANWLIGRWEKTTDQGTLSETWKQDSDSSFVGASYFVSGNDTLFSESICLVEMDGGLHYIPTVSDQNEEKPVVFTLIHSTTNKLVFENHKHDFPQNIRYTHNNDSLIAVISGKEDGKLRQEVFAMKKVVN